MSAPTIYEYTDALGTPMARKKKYVDVISGGKRFVWEHVTGQRPDGELTFSKGLNGWTPGLYRADEMVQAASEGARVWLCEGEKDADALRELGYRATSVPNGAGHGPGKWSDAWADVLRGASQVVVVADDDEQGRAHGARVALALTALLPCGVGLVLPADGCKDAADHVAAGNGRADWRWQSQAEAAAWATATASTIGAGESSEPDGGEVDVNGLMMQAFGQVSTQGRNLSGFWLACQLRDGGLTREDTEAVLVGRYAPAANALGSKKSDPYTEGEARESVRQAYSHEARDPAPGVTRGYKCTEVGNADRFVAQHGADLRYVAEWGRWLVWDGTRWARDRVLTVTEKAKQTAASIYAEAASAKDSDSRARLGKWAVASEKRGQIDSMIALARNELPVLPEDLDVDPWLVNCPNGVLDLRSGELLPHDSSRLISKSTGVAFNPRAKAPRWEAFLKTVLPDADVRAFVQKAVGYSLTGDTSEQVLFLVYGSGQNGKTTFLEAVRRVVGEYAQNAPTEMLLQKPNGGGIPNDVARMQGARFVTASETAKGRKLEETLVKKLTGGDEMTARFMRGEFFDFTPVAKIWMATNHKPIIQGTDEGIWRRIRLVGFTTHIPEEDRDPDLPGALAAEAQGILAWAVRGVLAWQRDGLAPPESVAEATAKYRADMDVLGDFLTEACKVSDAAIGDRAALFELYRMWCDEKGLRAPSANGFYEMLRDRGFAEGRKRLQGQKQPRHVFLGIEPGSVRNWL